MNPHLQPWSILAEEFPADGFVSDRIEFLLRYAVLAPSRLNSQPWLFRLHHNDVEFLADLRRTLPTVDSRNRELHIACGAALYNFRVAAEYFGQSHTVELLPSPARPEVLARVRLGQVMDTSSEDVVLFHAITERRTNRGRFLTDPIPEPVLGELADAADMESAWLVLVTDEAARLELARLVAEADRLLWSDRAFRRDVARWVRTDTEHQADGLSTRDFGVSDWIAFAGPSLVRAFDRGNERATVDLDYAAHAPALAALGTEGDEPLHWLRAGMALQRVLLHAQSQGVAASYLNQPIEVEELRFRMAGMLGRNGQPQVLLRLGYAREGRPAPRRSVKHVLLHQESSAHAHGHTQTPAR